MIPCQRHLFEIPDDIAYFNAAYMTPLMRSVRAAGEAGLARKSAPWDIHLEDFYALPDAGRAVFARLVGAAPDDIAIVPSASYGLETAAANVVTGTGGRILILADQYPSNVYAWREAAARTGAEIVTLPRPEDWNWTRAILAAIDERTTVVALPHCHWTDGTRIDLVAVGRRCREAGAALVLDLTQSLGAMPFDAAAVRPAFAVCATYKWLLGPYSLGFLYVAPEYQQKGRPIEHSPFARLKSNEPAEWYSGKLTYHDGYLPGARRFDVGERSNFALLPMAITAIEQILDWGVDNIHETLRETTDAIARHCTDRGLIAAPREQRSGHLIGIRFPGAFPAGLQDRLQEQRVHASSRSDSLRIAPHLYNNAEDLGRLLSAIDGAR